MDVLSFCSVGRSLSLLQFFSHTTNIQIFYEECYFRSFNCSVKKSEIEIWRLSYYHRPQLTPKNSYAYSRHLCVYVPISVMFTLALASAKCYSISFLGGKLFRMVVFVDFDFFWIKQLPMIHEYKLQIRIRKSR